MVKNRKIAYFRLPITVEPCEEGGYFAKCHQLQGCFAEGETLPEVWENIQSVAELIIESMIEWGDPLPQPLVGMTALAVTSRGITNKFVTPPFVVV